MRQGWMIAIGLLIAGFTAASAQSDIPPRTTTAAPVARPDDRALSPAPVGHRQPRVDDMQTPPAGAAQAVDDENARQDAVLDARIRGICKGC